MSNYLSEAFKKLEILDEDVFDLDKDGLTALKDFEDKDEDDDSIAVIDPDAESEEDLEDSYIGKVILDCSVCHTDIYKDKEDIIIDEEAGLANIGEECPYCYSSEGFKVIGEVKPFVETTFETEDDVDVEVDDEEVEKNESMRKSSKTYKKLNEGYNEDIDKIYQKLKVFMDRKGYDVTDHDTLQYLAAAAEYIGMSDEEYPVAEWYRDTKMNYPEELAELKLKESLKESSLKSVDSFIIELLNKYARGSEAGSPYKEFMFDNTYAIPLKDNMKYIGKVRNALESDGFSLVDSSDGEYYAYTKITDNGDKVLAGIFYNAGDRGEDNLILQIAVNPVDEELTMYFDESLKESTGEVFHNDNGLDYTVVERSKSGKNALLNRGKQWIIAWNCPQDNNGSWGQGHYFFDEDEAREWWSKKYIKESKAPMKISKKSIKESCSINQCQKWVDYDMKKYKKISDDTMEKIKSSGYSVVKDQYGDYEVIADRKDESCRKRKPRKMKESIEDNEQDIIDIGRAILDDNRKGITSSGNWWELKLKGNYGSYDLDEIADDVTGGSFSGKTDSGIMWKLKIDNKLKESIEDITIDTGDQEISVSARDKEKKSDGEMIAPLSDEMKADIEMDSDDVDVDVDEFSEEDFDELGESYLKKVYENVDSYKTTSAKTQGNKLFVEGLIKFNSGKEKKTSFVFESRTITKSGKAKLIGENLQISRGHKSFKLTGTINNGKFISESLNYNYRVKNGSESQRVYGTAKKSK